MLLEALVGSALIYYGARQFLEVRNHLMTRSRREELEARVNAQALYDSTIGEIFSKATCEEKQTILDIFSRYSPSN